MKSTMNQYNPIMKNVDGLPFENRIEVGSNGIVCVNIERKKIEDRLKINQFYLSEAERIGVIGHFELNLLTKEVVWSDQMFRILKITPKKNNVPNLWDHLNFIHEDDAQRVYNKYSECIEENKPINLKFRLVRKDGQVRYVHHTGYINRSIGPTKIYGVIHDYTLQQQNTDSLYRLNNKLETIVEKRAQIIEESQRIYKLIARNFPNGEITIFDRDLNYIFVEGMEMGHNGITGGMLIGTNFLNRTDPTIKDELKATLTGVFEGKNTSFELKTEDKTFMIYAVGLKDNNKEIQQIMLVSQNITSLKKAEEDIRRSLVKEKHLNELKSRFVSMASHEFRTPLTTTMNSIALLSKYIGNSGNEEKQRKHISRIKNSIYHLTTLLNDFLSLDKLEQGKVKIVMVEFNLPELVRDILRDIRGVTKTGQRIVYQHEGEELFIGDAQKLKIIFNNLLANAIKYSPEESLIYFTTSLMDNNLSTIVKDEGIGVPQEEQNHLFERFFRAQNALNIQGTGLGLNIIKSYIELMDGEINFTSEANKGTTFKVIVPQGEYKTAEQN